MSSRHTPPNLLLCISIILNCRHLKGSRCRERLFLNCPYLLKDRSSRQNPAVTDPLPGSFINQRRLTHHRSGCCRSPYNIQTLSLTILPPIYSSKGPFIFLKNHLFSPERLPLLSLLGWYLSLNS